MIDTKRLQRAMVDAGKDQSALARAVGCTPGAINQIVLGNVSRSRFLPDIAEELGVSLRWLRGDDVGPDPTVPRPPKPAQAQQSVTMQVLLPSEAALARMFEGLLLPLDLTAPKAEIAQLLARRLPTGFAQLRDLLPEHAPAAKHAPDEAAPAPAKDHPASPPASHT